MVNMPKMTQMKISQTPPSFNFYSAHEFHKLKTSLASVVKHLLQCIKTFVPWKAHEFHKLKTSLVLVVKNLL